LRWGTSWRFLIQPNWTLSVLAADLSAGGRCEVLGGVMNRLASLFNIRPGEGRLVLLLLAHSFCIGVARIFTRTAAYTLFLVEFDAQALPYVYIGISLSVTLVSFIILRLAEHLSFSKLLAANLGFLALLLGSFRLGLGFTDARWLTFALPIWYEMLWTLTGLESRSLAGRLFTVRQGKRLFGLIGAGEWVAIIVGGFLVPGLVKLLGTLNLLLVAAGGIAGALGLLVHITRSFADPILASAEKVLPEGRKSSAGLLKNRYVVLIFVLFALSQVGYFFVDNVFYAQAEVQYPAEDQLAGFIGLFFALTALLALFSTTFLSGPIISRYGLRVSLLVLPVALTASTASIAITGTFVGLIVLLFGLAALTKLLSVVLMESIDQSALMILYQPLPADQRLRTQTAVEGIVYSIAVGVAGLTLSLLNKLFAFQAFQLAYVLLFILAAWILVAIRLGREYPVQLMQALAKRRLGGADLSLTDGSSVAVLQQGLQSSHPGAVIYSLNMLEAMEHESLVTCLQDLLAHPAPEVRQDVLERIERLGLTLALAAVGQRVALEPSPAVRGMTLRTLVALGGTGVFEKVFPYLKDPDPQVRRGAMVGLLCGGGIEGVLAAGHELLQMVASPEPAERTFAAQVLGEVGVRSFHEPLVPLLGDDDPQVRRAALLAAGQLKAPRLWPLVLEGLGAPQVSGAAVAALVAGGESILPELKAAFAQEGQERAILIRLAQICGRIQGDRVIALLKDKVDYPDVAVRTQVLRSLSRCGYQAWGEEVARVQGQIKAEIADATWTLAALVDIGSGEDDGVVFLLQEALAAKLAHNRTRVFYLLSFIYDAPSILRARDNLLHASAGKRAYALEAIDILISQELKGMLLPLLRDLPPSQRFQHLGASFPQPEVDRHRRLQEIIAGPDERFSPWIKACALYAVGRLSAAELCETVVTALSVPAPLVRETAAWTLLRLDPEGLETASKGGEVMLSAIEKVIILKTVSIFARTPDEILAEVAALLEEVELKEGETIFEKGDAGDCMYIIVDGRVRVHDGGRTLNYLGEGDVFGEMAVLDPEPRLASVTAVEDTRLFRLDQEPFYELMDDRIEVARGIIRVLSQHLRARVRDLNDLRTRFEALEGSSETKKE
jgi:AAA family ATP:ADP antiporter